MSVAATALPAVLPSRVDDTHSSTNQQTQSSSNFPRAHLTRLISVGAVYQSFSSSNFNLAEFGERQHAAVGIHVPGSRTSVISATRIPSNSLNSSSSSGTLSSRHPIVAIPYSYSHSVPQPIFIPIVTPMHVGQASFAYLSTRSSLNSSIALPSLRPTIGPATTISRASIPQLTRTSAYPAYLRCNSVSSVGLEGSMRDETQLTMPLLTHGISWQVEETSPNATIPLTSIPSFRNSVCSSMSYVNDSSLSLRNFADASENGIMYASSLDTETAMEQLCCAGPCVVYIRICLVQNTDVQMRSDDGAYTTATLNFPLATDNLSSDLTPQHNTFISSIGGTASNLVSQEFTSTARPYLTTAIPRSTSYTAIPRLVTTPNSSPNSYRMAMVAPAHYLVTRTSLTSNYRLPNLVYLASGELQYPQGRAIANTAYNSETSENVLPEIAFGTATTTASTLGRGTCSNSITGAAARIETHATHTEGPNHFSRAASPLFSTVLRMPSNRLRSLRTSSSSARSTYLNPEESHLEGIQSLADLRGTPRIDGGNHRSYQRYGSFGQQPVTRFASNSGRFAGRATSGFPGSTASIVDAIDENLVPSTISTIGENHVPLRLTSRSQSNTTVHGASHGHRRTNDTISTHVPRPVTERLRVPYENRQHQRDAEDNAQDAGGAVRQSATTRVRTGAVFVRNLRPRSRRGLEVDALDELEYESLLELQAAVGYVSRGVPTSLIHVAKIAMLACISFFLYRQVARGNKRNRKTCPLCRFEVDQGLCTEAVEDDTLAANSYVRVVETVSHPPDLNRESTIFPSVRSMNSAAAYSPIASSLNSALLSPLSSLNAASWLRHIGNRIFGSSMSPSTSVPTRITVPGLRPAYCSSYSVVEQTAQEQQSHSSTTSNSSSNTANVTTTNTVVVEEHEASNSAVDNSVPGQEEVLEDEEIFEDSVVAHISGVVNQLIDSAEEDGGTGGAFENCLLSEITTSTSDVFMHAPVNDVRDNSSNLLLSSSITVSNRCASRNVEDIRNAEEVYVRTNLANNASATINTFTSYQCTSFADSNRTNLTVVNETVASPENNSKKIFETMKNVETTIMSQKNSREVMEIEQEDAEDKENVSTTII